MASVDVFNTSNKFATDIADTLLCVTQTFSSDVYHGFTILACSIGTYIKRVLKVSPIQRCFDVVGKTSSVLPVALVASFYEKGSNYLKDYAMNVIEHCAEVFVSL